uniref:Uncharacterized protein n=1 Tax=Anguilla anguilla TaxID=7936 RepID=A0A0E9RZH4_ANGAN
MTTALPAARAAPSKETKESRGLLSGRTTPITPIGSGKERAEPDWGRDCTPPPSLSQWAAQSQSREMLRSTSISAASSRMPV